MHRLWRYFISPLRAYARQRLSRFNNQANTFERPVLPDTAACLESLSDWMHSRRVLSVAAGPWQGQSLLLAIDPKRELIWLDDIFPAQEALSEGQNLKVSLRQGFEYCYFNAIVVAIVHKPQGRIIALHAPCEIHRAPRRGHSRFHLPGPALYAKIRAFGLNAENGQVVNISAGGMRLSLSGNLLKSYPPGTSLPFCRFQLSPDIVITCRAMIKATTFDKNISRSTQVSIVFADITREQRQRIDVYLHKLEAFGSCRQALVSA